jgi:hypothetical protein
MARAVLALALLSVAAGCALRAREPVPPVYTQEELRDICLRTGGWWRGGLITAYCEYQADGFP